MLRRVAFSDQLKVGNLGRGAHMVELYHQPRLASGSVVLMDNVLASDPIEHAQRIANRERGDLLIAVLDRQLGLLDVRAGGRNIRPVPLPAPLSDSNALLGGFAICQLELPLASWLELIRRTQNNGISAAAARWYQTRRKSTTDLHVKGQPR